MWPYPRPCRRGAGPVQSCLVQYAMLSSLAALQSLAHIALIPVLISRGPPAACRIRAMHSELALNRAKASNLRNMV